MKDSKYCASCRQILPASLFGLVNGKLAPYCRLCKSIKDAAYRAANKEKIAAQKRQAYLDNAEALKARQRAYYAENKDRLAPYFAAYRAKNLDRIKEYRKRHYYANRADYIDNAGRWRIENRERSSLYMKQYRVINRQRLREKAAIYYMNNRAEMSRRNRIRRLANHDAIREARRRDYELNKPKHRAWEHVRRARKSSADGRFSASDVQNLLGLQRWKCACCRVSLRRGYHVDHIIPLAKGGSNWPWNLQLLCPPCNLRKQARDPLHFMQDNGFLL